MATIATSAVQKLDKRLSEIRATEAKPVGNKVSTSPSEWDRQLGQALDYAFSLTNRTQKEIWVALGYESGAQVSLWISGERKPDFAAMFAIEWLRRPLVIALAGLAEAEVTTEIRWRRG